MVGGYSASASTSEENKFGSTYTDNTSSGQHGLLVNFVTGKDNKLTPTYTDSSGSQPWPLIIGGALLLGGVAWWFLRRGKGSK